jgi:hypothetical protein
MGTRTIFFCDECDKDRVGDENAWYTGVLSTDGGGKPSVQCSGLFCSTDCLLKAIDRFLQKDDVDPPEKE